jgi:hypothetical protein
MFKEVMNDLWLARISSLSNEDLNVNLYQNTNVWLICIIDINRLRKISQKNPEYKSNQIKKFYLKSVHFITVQHKLSRAFQTDMHNTC